jgi:UDP-N-acetyl-D-glucosamine dehydrogenase
MVQALQKSASSLDTKALLARFSNAEATVAIMGMGYVGFPLAISTHAKGFAVLAFDIDAAKVESLNAGKSYLKGIEDGTVSAMRAKGKF